MSLSEMVQYPSPNQPPQRRAADYTWRRLPSYAPMIREEHEKRVFVQAVKFDTMPEENKTTKWEELLYHFGDWFKAFSECWEYEDGAVLVSACFSTFGGTDHDPDNEVLYFIATPKRPVRRTVAKPPVPGARKFDLGD